MTRGRFVAIAVALAVSFPLALIRAGEVVTLSAEQRRDALLSAMGGRQAWSAIAGMHVAATHYDAHVQLPFANRIWNDFRRPLVRIEARNSEIHRVRLLNGDAGWRHTEQSEAVSLLDPQAVEQERRWWESNIYRTLARLARGDQDLLVGLLAPDKLAVFRKDGTRLNWFRLNARHEPVAFDSWENESGTVFGPLVDGPRGIRYPKWGTGIDGRWRYEIERVEVYTDDVPVETRPPSP